MSRLYPHVPSLALWRTWELAAYRRTKLVEPVLDLGCGDGAFFRAIWPDVRDAVGVDTDPSMLANARRSGVYREVHAMAAQELPFAPARFASTFANCSLEHMVEIDRVLTNVARVTRPGGAFVLSVVTDKWLAWQMLPLLATKLAGSACGERLRHEYLESAVTCNPFAPEEWQMRLERAGFVVVQHVPLLPEITSRLFLLIDELWHVKQPGGELGATLHGWLGQLRGFPGAFEKILDACLDLERDPWIGSGAVFVAERLAEHQQVP